MSCDFSAIQFDKCDVSSLDKATRQNLVTFAKQINPYQDAILEIILIVFIVHHIAIIYNAQRAIDLAAVTDQCNAANNTNVTSVATNAIWAGRLGLMICTIMLVISRLLSVTKGATGQIIQIVFGVLGLALFIADLVLATQITNEAGKCTTGATIPSVTVRPDQGALGELKTAAMNMTAWGAVGLVASLLYIAWFVFQLVSAGNHKLFVTALSD